jgi:3-hydroxyisobutyrate dehydrogenase-like beta-hydroxyacid dehydrogenase
MKPVSSDKRIAFIGLGKMGGGFSRNLIKKGYNLNLFDADPNVLKRFEHTNGKLCLSIEECVNDADYVFTSLPNSKIVRDVYLGEKGILKSLKKKSTLIELSTIDPITSAEIEKNTLGRGNGYLAVTIGKGPSQAERGESPLFIGGSEETFSRSKEILLDIGSNLYYFGTVEKCISFKLISNLIGMVNLAALAEGYALALEYGIEPDVFKKALNETGGKSYQQEIRLDMLIQGDFTEKFALQYTVKDLGLANDLAREKNFPLFISPLVFNIYQSVNAKGYGKLDSAAVLKFFERGE